MQVFLRYGRAGLNVEIPDGNVAHVLHMTPLPPLSDTDAAVRDALLHPLGTLPLAKLARGRRDAVVVISDITRPVPNRLLVPPLLQCLTDAGIAPGDILILVATGLHRASTDEELAEMLGPKIVGGGFRIASHIARDPGAHVDLGVTGRGIPVQVDRRYVEADLKILTGLVEPHLMAGYSGGRKAICPGLCGEATIMAWHSPRMLAPENARAGSVTGNPVHEEALVIADMAGGADFILNVVLDEQRAIKGVFGGEMHAAHLAAMTLAERQSRVVVPEPVDIVVTTAAGYPLDLTFYQGIKGMVGAMPIVKPGGTIIIAQENAEGLGSPEFSELILGHDSLQEMVEALFSGALCSIDQWQLQEMEKVCRRARVLNYSTGISWDLQRRLFVEPVQSVEAGIAMALEEHGQDARIAVIPEGPYVLCCLADEPIAGDSLQ